MPSSRFYENPSAFRMEFFPGPDAHLLLPPRTRKSRKTGDTALAPAEPASPQSQGVSSVAQSEQPSITPASHHVGETGGHSPVAASEAQPAGANTGAPVTCAALVGETDVADDSAPVTALVTGVASAAAALRRPLTDEEMAKALAYLECGHSLRSAAAELGRHHTTLLKRIRSDQAMADAVAAAREKARSAPLAQVREASKSSWRAAAWLVKYLDARAAGGPRPKSKRGVAAFASMSHEGREGTSDVPTEPLAEQENLNMDDLG